MPESVYLEFVPPDEIEDLTKLIIYESDAPDGTFAEIEQVTAIGASGNYIRHYTTNLATSKTDWFAIRWEDSKGAQTEMSEAVQGGTRSVVADVVSRMLLRDPTLNPEIAFQEAEAVVEEVTGTVEPNPLSVSKKYLNGMTLLALARSQLYVFATGTSTAGDSWVAGLVSMKSSTGTATTNIANLKDLMQAASWMLGLSFSRVAQICVPEIAGGLAEIVTADISRLLIEVE